MPATGDSGADDRYTAWRGVYRASRWGRPRKPRPRRCRAWSRARRTGGALLAAGAVLVVWFAVRVVVALVRWDLEALVELLLSPGVLVFVFSAVWASLPSETRVTADGVVVRSDLWRTRSVPWADVVEVGPPGRFDEHPVAHLSDGERLALVGLPVEVARAMAEVTASPPPVSRDAPPEEPASDDDLDGPFRRGRAGR